MAKPRRALANQCIYVGAAVIVWAAGMLLMVVRAFSGSPRELAHPVPLAPDWVLKIEGTVFAARIEKAFYVSSHGGWHGDGTAVIAYRLDGGDFATLVRSLEEKTPALGWSERPARDTPLAQFGRLFPEEFRPHPDERLRYGCAMPGAVTREYYVDVRRATIYVADHTF